MALRSITKDAADRRSAVLGRRGDLALAQAVRLSWGVADQAMSSLSNFAVNIYIARTLGAVQYGAFALAYVTYGFALNASRGLATDPLLVRFSGTDHPDLAARRRQVHRDRHRRGPGDRRLRRSPWPRCSAARPGWPSWRSG